MRGSLVLIRPWLVQNFANDLAQEMGASQYADSLKFRVARTQGNGQSYGIGAARIAPGIPEADLVESRGPRCVLALAKIRFFDVGRRSVPDDLQ